MSGSPTGVELSAFLRQIDRGMRPADIMDAVTGRVRRVVPAVHREGALPQDRAAWARTLVGRAASLRAFGGQSVDSVPFMRAVRPAEQLDTPGGPNWPLAWREVLTKHPQRLPMPEFAVLGDDGAPYFSLDVCTGEDGFEDAIARVTAANSLLDLRSMRVSCGPREDLLTAAGVLMLLPFTSDDTDAIGRMLGLYYAALERTHGSLSRKQDGYVGPKVTVAPTALVPEEWVSDGIGATVWLPVSTLFDIGHQVDGLPGPLPAARG